MFGQGAPNERINGSKLQNLFPSLRFKWINWILGNTGEARMTRMTLLRNPNLNPSAANFYTAAAVGHWGKDLFHILNREQERGSRSWCFLTLYHAPKWKCWEVFNTNTKILIKFETFGQILGWAQIKQYESGKVYYLNLISRHFVQTFYFSQPPLIFFITHYEDNEGIFIPVLL